MNTSHFNSDPIFHSYLVQRIDRTYHSYAMIVIRLLPDNTTFTRAIQLFITNLTLKTQRKLQTHLLGTFCISVPQWCTPAAMHIRYDPNLRVVIAAGRTDPRTKSRAEIAASILLGHASVLTTANLAGLRLMCVSPHRERERASESSVLTQGASAIKSTRGAMPVDRIAPACNYRACTGEREMHRPTKPSADMRREG